MTLSQRAGLKETFPFCIIHFPVAFSFVNNKHMLLLELSQTEVRKSRKKLKFLKREDHLRMHLRQNSHSSQKPEHQTSLSVTAAL